MKRTILIALVFASSCQSPEQPTSDSSIRQRDGGVAASDSSCTPRCGVESCGADGCGGSCGVCSHQCVNGRCQCEPSCHGRQCGSDGCGGSCGSCSANASCGPSGRCRAQYPLCDSQTCPSPERCWFDSPSLGECTVDCDLFQPHKHCPLGTICSGRFLNPHDSSVWSLCRRPGLEEGAACDGAAKACGKGPCSASTTAVRYLATHPTAVHQPLSNACPSPLSTRTSAALAPARGLRASSLQ
jgi:hypothetical protein